MRKQRKDEHIEKYLKTEYVGNTLLSDVYIEPTSLPELSINDIDTSIMFCGKKINFPLMINAMTGGTEMTETINQDLSMMAASLGIPMQVGSEKIALEDDSAKESFRVVRSALGKDSVVISNLGSKATIEEVKSAMELIDADAIGIHINPSQELVMGEGERDFRGTIENIKALCNEFPGKIIAKEVGFGMRREVGEKLRDAGVTMIDVSGGGGTNFMEIEDLRVSKDHSAFYDFGVPTAISIINVREACPEQMIIASGGIKNGMDIVKAIILGADLCGMSGEILRYLLVGNFEYAKEYLESVVLQMKEAMCLLGVKNIEELKKVPYKVTGKLSELLNQEWKTSKR